MRASIANWVARRQVVGQKPSLKVSANSWDDRLARNDLNSFDVVRLVLASLVVLEHSYFLIDNETTRDPVSILSGGQTNSGQLAVYMFFSLSGFLVTSSLLDSSGVVSFLIKRIARVVPGFLVATAVGCLIVGPLTSNDLVQFFHEQNWRNIIIEALALKQVGVRGILQGNPIQLVHGTLWSIVYEFNCYLLLALFGILGLMRPPCFVLLYASIAVALAAAMAVGLPSIDNGILGLLISSPDNWPVLFPFFFVGSAFFVFRSYIPKSGALLVASVTWIIISFCLGGAYWALLLGGTYVILFASLSAALQVKVFGRRIDLSYGVYLYGWPVQQLLLFYSGMKLPALALFAIALPMSYVIAWLSWTLVERPSLGLVRHRSWRDGREGLKTLAALKVDGSTARGGT
jgi:peptidoglycan/LPS O-acetylase OafA/YrhL